MKTLIALLLSCAALLGQQIDGRVTLEFDYPTNEIAGMTFKAYHTTSLQSSWQHVATVESTNRFQLTVVPGENFFVCTASNFWGESSFSNVASTPALPRSDVILRIRRGH